MPQWPLERTMFVDSHCHPLGNHGGTHSPDTLVARALEAGVLGVVAVGTHLEDSREVLALAHRMQGVRACVGVHPHDARTWQRDTGTQLAALATDSHVLFVGETGLDWHYDLSPREVQEAVFRQQIQLALRIGKPLMIHTRSAPEATLSILQEEGAGSVGGVFHCFSEDLPFARRALDLGFHLSFSGLVTFKKAEAIQEVAKWAPLDRILVETDAPFLAPVPHRGRTNEPAYVLLVGEAVARLRRIPAEALAEATCGNLEALCGWRP